MFGAGSCGGWEKSVRTLSPFFRGFGCLFLLLLFYFCRGTKSKMGWIPCFFVFICCFFCCFLFLLLFVCLNQKIKANLENFSLLRNTFFLRLEEQKSRDFPFFVCFIKHNNTKNEHTQKRYTKKIQRNIKRGFGLFENFLRN